MASSQDFIRLKEEMICPICSDILQDPVTIDCGHNFCRGCIIKNVGPSDGLLICPLCKKSVRKDMLMPNWLLVNLVEKIQTIRPFEKQPERQELRCLKHREKLHYFCENDGKLLCMVCYQSKEHKLHKINLVEEAAPRYQVLIQSQLETLQQKEKALVQMKAKGEQKISEFKAQVENEKQRIIREVKLLQQVLQEEEEALLSQMNWLGQEGAKGGNHYITSTEAQLNSLGRCVESLRAKQQMSPSDLLLDIKDVLNGSQGFQFLNPNPIPLDLEKILSDAISRHNSITDALKRCRDSLQPDQKRIKSTFFIDSSQDTSKNFAANVLENNNSKMNKTLEPELPSTGSRTTKQPPPNPGSLNVHGPLPFKPSTLKEMNPELLQPRSRKSYAGVSQLRANFENIVGAEATRREEFKGALSNGTKQLASNSCSSTAMPPGLLQPRNRASFAGNLQLPGNVKNLENTGATRREEFKRAPTSVTLDTASAHPDLILSQDLKTVKLDIGPLCDSEEPANPRCFYPFYCVVGLPGLSSGQQTWEAELQGPRGGACEVGVVSEYASRQGYLQIEPLAGFWVLRIKGTRCQALTQAHTAEELPIRPSKVGVHVDHDHGEVVFYDAISSKHIYTFQASFQGRIFPFFRLLSSGTQITLSP